MAEPDTPSDPNSSTPGERPPEDFPESDLHPQERTPGREGLGSDLRPGNTTPFRTANYDPVSLRHIDWPVAFPFTNLFRGFRLAVHPSKLVLALAAVFLLYAGGRILDSVWMNQHQAFPGEAERFDGYTTRGENAGQSFGEIRREAREAIAGEYAMWREDAAAALNKPMAEVELEEVKTFIQNRRNREVSRANETYNTAAARIASNRDLSDNQREELREAAGRERDAAKRAAFNNAAEDWENITQFRGRGLFAEFYEYETTQFDRGLNAVLDLDIRNMLGAVYRTLYIGPLWGLSQHPLYFSLFFLWFLVLAAIFGGAISRIAAVQVARDEKISLRSAVRFSTDKFVSFLSAPLIPILIIAAIGLLVAIAGMLGNIPWLGELILGIAFILALIAGFLITLVLIGLVGGFSLMYPTIAAEGTDSFDAISRSFSYLYAKPWRLAFYALAALIYGAITYLFVRLFVWLVLISSHTAAALFIWRGEAGQDDVLSAMWPPPPTYRDLSYDISYINLTWIQDVSATLLAFWVYLMIAMAAAYAVSLYYSLSTIVYFLMRREVDATELDDVYLDTHDEEFAGYSDVPDADTEAPVEPAPLADTPRKSE